MQLVLFVCRHSVYVGGIASIHEAAQVTELDPFERTLHSITKQKGNFYRGTS